jgi:hypothetical protein
MCRDVFFENQAKFINVFNGKRVGFLRLNLMNGIARKHKDLKQRFSNFIQVGTPFVSQNVLRTTLLLNVLSIC